MEPLSQGQGRARTIGLGCLMTVLGFMSMAMVGVLASALVAFFTKAATCPDIPACNWYIYAGVGGLLGAISLPYLVIRRLRQSEQNTDKTHTP